MFLTVQFAPEVTQEKQTNIVYLSGPIFGNERKHMLNEFGMLNFRPSVWNLLYGSEQYSAEMNIKAFNLIQLYVSSTDRV